MDEKGFATDRNQMVDVQIAARGVSSARVLDAMRFVPRHKFVQPEHRYLAYSDGPLPIGSGQTISQPYIVALMSELLDLKGGEKVLEVGTGSGYQAAVLAFLAREIHSIERHKWLAQRAEGILDELGLENVSVHVGDGSLGLPKEAPFDAIIVTAAAPSVPQPLLEQLGEGGRLVVPVGSRGGQFLEVWRQENGEQLVESLIPVAFVPLIGEQGWKE
jgi:protein-L-isoaspartate(D-aspartate) O-methyltransferase